MKKIFFVKVASDILKIKKEKPFLLDEEIIREFLTKTNFSSKKDKLESLKVADFVLKLKREKKSDKEVIQEILNSSLFED